MVENNDRDVPEVDETERLAWVVLQTTNRTQARGSSVRLVVPRAPEVTHELAVPLGDDVLLTVEEYLLERGYVAPANIGLTWSSYTITPAGFNWLEGGLPEPSPTERVRELAEEPGAEAGFEAAIRDDLEEESRRMEEVERELEGVRQEPPEAPETVAEKQEPYLATGGTRDDQRPWWRRVFGG